MQPGGLAWRSMEEPKIINFWFRVCVCFSCCNIENRGDRDRYCLHMCVREAGFLCVQIAHMKCTLKIRKPVELFLFLPKPTHFCKNILILSGDQVPKYNILPARY
jgi:hypothetical protein